MMGRRRYLSIFFSLMVYALCLTGFSCTAQADSTDAIEVKVSGYFDYQQAYGVLSLTNQLRVSVGAPELKLDAGLTELAMQRAAEISLIFDHDRPDRTRWSSISGRVAGENIAEGQPTPQTAVLAWRESPGHYANIISTDYASIGIGCYFQNNTYYWVQLFGMEVEDAQDSAGENRFSEAKIRLSETLFNEYAQLICNGQKVNTSLEKGSQITVQPGFLSTLIDRETLTMDSSIPTLSWADFAVNSSNPAVLSIDNSGRIVARGAGKATVTLRHKTAAGASRTFTFTVTDPTRTVVLNANSGSMQKKKTVKTQKISLRTGGRYGSLPSPYKKGYQFAGWYTKKTGGSKITSTSVVNIAYGKTQTLYARWKKVSVAKAQISKVKSPAKKQIGVKWTTVSGADGYEIVVATSSNFKKKNIAITYISKGNKTKTCVLKKFKAGKKYYVRVRAFKYDSMGNKIYGACKAIKAVTVRKK